MSYPVNEIAKKAINQFPSISKAFRLPKRDRSNFEIVRLLSNTHYEHIRRSLNFIDKWLTLSGPIGRKLIRTKHPFALQQIAAELEIFVHLYEHFDNAVQAVESGSNSASPDIEVLFESWKVRIEVYTPVDFIGFQLFNRYVPMILKYLNIPCGYHLVVKSQPLQHSSNYDQSSLFYPYNIPGEEETRQWLSEFAKRILHWFSNEKPTKIFQMTGPGGKVEVVVEILIFEKNSEYRQICFNESTKSTDTRLYFEEGDSQDTVRTPWGLKLKNKLKNQQCGEFDEGVLRMLLVNFAMADTAWPHFISGKMFETRFREVVCHLDGGREYYDVVLPAQLGHDCCFGQPVWINNNTEVRFGNFIEKAGFNKQCVGFSNSTPEDIEFFLSCLTSEQSKK